MSGWGIYDAKTLYGTSVSVTNGSTTVDGVGTQFTANLAIGDIIGIHSDLFTKNRVASIANNTTLTLADPFLGTSNTSLPMSFVKENEQPKYAYQDGDAESGYDTIQRVYGVDVNEISSGGANVVAVAVVSGGTKYKEVPAITFSSGSAAATAVINRNGAVANVSLTATGNAYSSAPTVTIGAPFITFNGSSGSVVNASANTIAYTAHLFETGDAAVYSNGGGTSISGLTSANTYYVIKIGANSLALASSASNATSNTQVDITALGVGTSHTLTLTSGAATAIADLGVGTSAESQAAHAGWVKKTIGTGGRAGRIQYETLVAIGTITNDAVDDLSFPDR